jgi:peptide/nickel transport system permease protein
MSKSNLERFWYRKTNKRLRGASVPYFVLRRVAFVPAILLGAIFLVFVMVSLSRNDPAFAKLGPNATPEARAAFAATNGLNDSLLIRFWRFLVDLVHFRLGDSAVSQQSVGDMIDRAMPVTLQLVVMSSFVSVVLSLLLGALAAAHEGRTLDRAISSVAVVFQASPQFWIGALFVQLFAVSLKILPSSGYVSISQGLGSWFSAMIGPVIVLALPITGALTRVIRASMADELVKDYVRTAIGAGLPRIVVLANNVLRNALVAPITVLGLNIGALMSGALLVESIFNLPGIGSLLITGVNEGDLAVVRGVALIGALAFIGVNLIVDLLYIFLNPRSAEMSRM